MSLSLPRSVSTAPVAADRDATIGLTMAATIVTVAIGALLVVRIADVISTASVDLLLTVAAITISLALAIGAGMLVAGDAEWVRPTPPRRPDVE